MRLSELVRLGEGAQISPEWIKGIRKSWKKVAQQALGAGERNEGLDSIDALDNVIRYVQRLQQALFFGKGLYPFHGGKRTLQERSKQQAPFNLQAKVGVHLEEALEALDEGKSRMRFWMRVLDGKSTEFKLDHGQRYKRVIEDPEFKGRSPAMAVMKFLNKLQPVEVKNAIGKADKAISGKLLRALSSFTSKYPGMDVGETVDREFSVGSMKIVMEDIPLKNLRQLKPEEIAKIRSPMLARRYIEPMKKAEALLRNKKLGFLWKGLTRIKCKECGGKNRLSSLEKVWSVGGRYHVSTDHVEVFVNPKNYVAELMVHELGHRYWFKYMSQADRERFRADFGDVPAVSEYGSAHPEEDFAEVFAWYVLNRNLTRPQLQRFKQFLGRKKMRGSAVEGQLEDTGDKTWGDDPIYRMKLSRDRFVHFTLPDRAKQIQQSGKLLMNPPYKKFGADHVAAISLQWGMFQPGVQTTHIKVPLSKLVAVVFQTSKKPTRGFPEEVTWHSDVPIKNVKVIAAKRAVALLKKTPHAPKEEDFEVVYT